MAVLFHFGHIYLMSDGIQEDIMMGLESVFYQMCVMKVRCYCVLPALCNGSFIRSVVSKCVAVVMDVAVYLQVMWCLKVVLKAVNWHVLQRVGSDADIDSNSVADAVSIGSDNATTKYRNLLNFLFFCFVFCI
eukprot:565403_1